MFVDTMNTPELFNEFVKEFELEDYNDMKIEKIFLNNWTDDTPIHATCKSDRGNTLEKIKTMGEGICWYCRFLSKNGTKIFFRFPSAKKMLTYEAFMASPEFLTQYRELTMRPTRITLGQAFFKFIQINHTYTIKRGPAYIDKWGNEVSDDVLQCAEGTIRIKVVDKKYVVFTHFSKYRV